MQSLHAVGSFFCQSNFSSCSKKFATRVEKGIFFLFSKDGEIWSYALSMRSFSSTPSLQISSPNQREEDLFHGMKSVQKNLLSVQCG